MSKTYKSPKSKLIISITIILLIILTGVVIEFSTQIYSENRTSIRVANFIIIAIIVFFISISIYKSLKKIVLNESFFEIHYVGYKLTIPLAELISISPRKTLPSFFIGSQGFWGFNGKINGEVKVSVNSLDSMILIITKKKKLILSVENSRLFIEEFNQLICDVNS